MPVKMIVADGSGLLCDGKQQVENALKAGPESLEGRLPKLPVTQLSQACSGDPGDFTTAPARCWAHC